jgi:flagellar export protein FliJ
MINKASRLEPLANFAGLREEEAARRLATSTGQIQAKEAELERLRGYLAEYRQRAERDSTDSTRWQNARQFLSRLSDAVAHHERELENAIERHRFETERWRDSHQRAQALDKVIERSQREQVHALQRRDQAELDERAARHNVQPRR